MTDSDKRDYLAESFQLAEGKTMILPERGHVIALIQELRRTHRIAEPPQEPDSMKRQLLISAILAAMDRYRGGAHPYDRRAVAADLSQRCDGELEFVMRCYRRTLPAPVVTVRRALCNLRLT